MSYAVPSIPVPRVKKARWCCRLCRHEFSMRVDCVAFTHPCRPGLVEFPCKGGEEMGVAYLPTSVGSLTGPSLT